MLFDVLKKKIKVGDILRIKGCLFYRQDYHMHYKSFKSIKPFEVVRVGGVELELKSSGFGAGASYGSGPIVVYCDELDNFKLI